MRDLIFLLYELPPPLGKRSLSFTFLDSPSDNKNKGLRQQDRYIINYEKRIVIKKVDAIDLLKGLKIKVYNDPEKQVHYVYVFKALMKRIFLDKKMEIKLGVSLNRKMKGLWHKKHKDKVAGQKTQHTVLESQAGMIITKWARKISSVGGSLRDVQSLARHSSLAMTQKYIEVSEDAMKKVVG